MGGEFPLIFLLDGWSTKQIEIGKFVLMEIFSTLNSLLSNMNACYMNTNYKLIRLFEYLLWNVMQ